MLKRKSILTIPFLIALTLLIGCQLTATIVMEDEYDVKIVNKSGERVKVRWNENEYRYLDDECFIFISSVETGFHEIEIESDSPRSRSNIRQGKVFKVEIEADIDIIINDDSGDSMIVIRSW